MTNFEKYKDDLMKIEGHFAVDKTQRKVVGCSGSADGIEECIDCKDCLFNDTQYCFESDKIKWLYQESKILTDDEINLIETLNKVTGEKYKYIARDTTKVIRFFETKPNRNELNNYYNLKDGYFYIGIKFGLLFPNIKFEDGLYDIENKCFIK